MSANPRLPREVAGITAALEANPELLRQANALSEATDPCTQGASTPRTIRIWDEVPEVTTISAGKVEWLAEGIIPRASVVLLAGEPGSYKSWLALSLLRAFLNGSPFLGRPCARTYAMYLDRENPLSAVQERLAILGIDSLGPSKIWGGWLSDAPPAIRDERLLQMARERKPLIVFDSLIRFHDADENSATEMAEVMQGLRELANAGATVLALHHKPKGETSRYRGSSDILGGVDVAFSLSRDRQTNTLTLECFKNRLSEEFSMTLRPDLMDSGEFVATEAPEASAGREHINLLTQEIQNKPGQTQSELIGSTGIPQGRARALLEQQTGKLWRIERGPHNAKRFFALNDVEIEV